MEVCAVVPHCLMGLAGLEHAWCTQIGQRQAAAGNSSASTGVCLRKHTWCSLKHAVMLLVARLQHHQSDRKQSLKIGVHAGGSDDGSDMQQLQCGFGPCQTCSPELPAMQYWPQQQQPGLMPPPAVVAPACSLHLAARHLQQELVLQLSQLLQVRHLSLHGACMPELCIRMHAANKLGLVKNCTCA